MKNFKLLGMIGVSLALLSCAQDPAPEARITNLVHGIVKNVPVLVGGDTFENSQWTSMQQDEDLSELVQFARNSDHFVGAQTQINDRVRTMEVPPIFTGIADALSSVGESSGGSSSASEGLPSGPGSIASGSLPSSPANGGNGGSLPTGPSSTQGSLSATPALFAAASLGGGSVGLAEGYCKVMTGMMSYFGRCVPEFAPIKAELEAAFGTAACKANLAPAFEKLLADNGGAPAGLGSSMACLGEAFGKATCSPEGISTALSAAASDCGMQFQ